MSLPHCFEFSFDRLVLKRLVRIVLVSFSARRKNALLLSVGKKFCLHFHLQELDQALQYAMVVVRSIFNFFFASSAVLCFETLKFLPKLSIKTFFTSISKN